MDPVLWRVAFLCTGRGVIADTTVCGTPSRPNHPVAAALPIQSPPSTRRRRPPRRAPRPSRLRRGRRRAARPLPAPGPATITSPNGEAVVVGTKEYVLTGDPTVNTATGRCGVNFLGQTEGAACIYQDDLRYRATISTPDGQTCTQEGPALLRLIEGSRVLPDESLRRRSTTT